MKAKTKDYNEEYLNLVKRLAPRTNEPRSLFNAFIVGGFICIIGQFIRYFLMYVFGIYGDELAGALERVQGESVGKIDCTTIVIGRCEI